MEGQNDSIVADASLLHKMSLNKRRILLWGGIGLIGIGFMVFSGSDEVSSVVLEPRSVVEEISITGRVVPSEKTELAFQRNGRIVSVEKGIGDTVLRGDVVARIDASSEQAKLSQARADLAVAQADLDSLRQGTRSEEIVIKESEYKNRKLEFVNASSVMLVRLETAYLKGEDAVRNLTDPLYSNPRSAIPQLAIVTDSEVAHRLEITRVSLNALFSNWRTRIDDAKLAVDILPAVEDSREYIGMLRLYLDDVANAINNATPNSAYSQSALDGYKTDVATARTNLDTVDANIVVQIENLTKAKSALISAEDALSLARSGARVEDIRSAEGVLASREASVLQVQADLRETVLWSPITGTVTKQDAVVGQIASANSVIATIINSTGFEIEAFVPEVDIAQLSVGQGAVVTLDPFGTTEEFKATIIKIDPAETIIDGVSTYLTTFVFIESYPKIKSGMTANIDIETARSEQALAVPQRAIQTRDNKRFVHIYQSNGDIVEREVVLGIRGSDGYMEITGGVEEGERVIISGL